jgi:Txe/YoeB family toxin of toxin-antitoxin system
MSEWKILYTSDALKDKKKAFEAGFKDKINSLLDILRENPYTTYPPFEKLIGNYAGAYSRRINRQHRLVYSIYEDEKIVKIISMWSHYE